MSHPDVSRAKVVDLIAVRRAQLEERLDDVERHLAEVRGARGEWTDEEHDPEGFTLVHEWSRAEGQRAEMHAELRALEAAESKVWDGSYGTCVTCGQFIPVEQLELRPARTTCVACATEREARG